MKTELCFLKGAGVDPEDKLVRWEMEVEVLITILLNLKWIFFLLQKNGVSKLKIKKP